MGLLRANYRRSRKRTKASPAVYRQRARLSTQANLSNLSHPVRPKMPEYDPTYTRGGANVLGSATPGPIRHLIDNEDYDSLAELGEAIVNLQLSLHAESLKEADARTTSAQISLVEQTASKIVDTLTGSEEDFAAISGIPAQLAHKAIWESEALPYYAFRTLRKLLDRHDSGDTLPGSSEFGERDIDDWILANERNLRDDRRSDWMRGLVDYDAHADAVFNPSPETTSAARVIHREKLSGYTFLDELRATSISIQPSSASFRSMFNRITNGLLSGLDWSNVLIAGGIVLSTLVSTSDADIEKYISSDIDIYIYGLDPVAANRKIQHIFDVWKSNLPTASQDKTLVVRNSRTITFFSEYPVKRVQVVLKLVKSPKEVLLNFDLDICAMGYDGYSLVMLPRAARALETGYNVFTMDLVQGHYLGQRRASQESRVFKYADKVVKDYFPFAPNRCRFSLCCHFIDLQGYGIRILDSYVRALTVAFPAGSGAERANQWEVEADRCAPNLEEIADRAAQWTQKAIKNYRWYIPFNNPSIVVPAVMEMTHSMLEERSIVTSEPGERSCLTSFEVLMRHVELWREEVRGHIALTKEHWATNDYDVGATGYDDSPVYAWGKDFELEAFKHTLEEYNQKDYTAFETSYDTIMEGEFEQAEVDLSTIGKTRRVSFAPEVSSLLEPEGDIILLFFASPGFATFANDLVKAALQEHSLPLPNSESDEWDMIQILGPYTRQQQGDEEVDLEMLKWRINAVIGWQQIDRRIDEVFEILWSFYRAYGEVQVLSADLSRKFFTEVGRRAIRPTPMDEYTAFGRWVMRGAPRIGESYGGMGQGFFGWTDDEEADEEEHVDEPEPAFFD